MARRPVSARSGNIGSIIARADLPSLAQWLSRRPSKVELGQALISLAGYFDASEAMIRSLVAAGADPNFCRRPGDSGASPPLSKAAAASSTQTLKCLVELGADPHYGDPNGYNALIFAVLHSTDAIVGNVEFLISLGLDVNAETRWHESPLSIASRRGKFQIVSLLLQAGADASLLGWTPLMHAIACGGKAECEAGLAMSPSLDHRDSWDRTPFLLAAQAGDVDKADLLLDAGAEVDERGFGGKTALIYASETNRVAMAEWLAFKGVDLEATDNFGRTALIAAASAGAPACVKVLLNLGAKFDALTAAGYAAIDEARDIETVMALQAAGSDVNRINGEGRSVLIAACEAVNVKFVADLLAAGVNPNATSAGLGPLREAVSRDAIEIIELLLEHGADPNWRDCDGWTPLFSCRSPEAARLLTQAGADVGIEDSIGNKAEHYTGSAVLGVAEPDYRGLKSRPKPERRS